MEPKTSDRPIAVIDSGVGGISVLHELIKLMPNENFLFFGDEANAPYGTKRREQVRDITLSNVERLIAEEQIKAVVVACNTATGAAVSALRERYPEMPIIGIEPEIKSAANVSEHPHVLIMATPLTLKQPKFLALRDRFSEAADFTLLPCPGLMELIEDGHVCDLLLEGYLSSLFAELSDRSFDAIVLGCTHYPHVRSSIAARFPDAAIFDGCRGTAAEAKRRIEAAGLAGDGEDGGKLRFITTAENPDFESVCRMLLEG